MLCRESPRQGWRSIHLLIAALGHALIVHLAPEGTLGVLVRLLIAGLNQQDTDHPADEIRGDEVLPGLLISELGQRWPRLFGQIFRFDKWIVCRG
jgi:hypothetical protein